MFDVLLLTTPSDRWLRLFALFRAIQEMSIDFFFIGLWIVAFRVFASFRLLYVPMSFVLKTALADRYFCYLAPSGLPIVDFHISNNG